MSNLHKLLSAVEVCLATTKTKSDNAERRKECGVLFLFCAVCSFLCVFFSSLPRVFAVVAVAAAATAAVVVAAVVVAVVFFMNSNNGREELLFCFLFLFLTKPKRFRLLCNENTHVKSCSQTSSCVHTVC